MSMKDRPLKIVKMPEVTLLERDGAVHVGQFGS
jgi:hypothetical protein